MNKENITLGIAIIAIIVALGGQLVGNQPVQEPQKQITAQELLDELGGSTSSFWTVGGVLTVSGASVLSGDLTIDSTDLFVDASADTASFGTSSPAHDFVVSGSATSTFSGDENSATTSNFIYSREALFGGQIILENPDGATCSNVVLDDAGTALVVATITCPIE